MSKLIYIGLFLFSVFIASLSQIFLKKSAMKTHKKFRYEYLNKEVFYSYVLFAISTLMTTLAYKEVEMKLGPVLEASGYIYVIILSYFVLHEKVNKKQFIGIFFIFIGIVVFTLDF